MTWDSNPRRRPNSITLWPSPPKTHSQGQPIRLAYSTLDNTDIIPHVFGAFDNFFVVDMKVHYNATKNFSFDFGIDNLFNEQYILFHPFPGRTFVLAGKYTF